MSAYPIRLAPDDNRFSSDLIFDVEDVLVQYGFPSFHGSVAFGDTSDALRLRQSLFRFIYGVGG